MREPWSSLAGEEKTRQSWGFLVDKREILRQTWRSLVDTYEIMSSH